MPPMMTMTKASITAVAAMPCAAVTSGAASTPPSAARPQPIPNTPERIKLIVEKSRGFIYLVSLTGVTGARDKLSAGLSDFVARVRAETDTPLAVGFGIGNGEQARVVAELVDGVIVGSALVKRAGISQEEVRSLALELRAALQGPGNGLNGPLG